VALGLKGLHGTFNAIFNGSDDFKRVMFMPSNIVQYYYAGNFQTVPYPG
jgi:hypothetical protein